MWMLGLVLLVDSMDQSIVRGLVTPLKEEFGVGDAAIGLLTSAFVLVNGLITVPAGYLADRWNRTRTIGHTVLAWSAVTALGAVMPNFGALVATRGALGFGQGITEPSAASLVADFYPLPRRGRAFAIQQVMLIVGFGGGVGIGGAVGATIGWRWAFLIVAAPGLVVAILAYRLREPIRGEADRAHPELAAAQVGITVQEPDRPLFEDGFGTFVRDMLRGLRADLRTIAGITTMRYALVGVASLLFTVNAVGTWLPQFYQRQLGVAQGQAEGYVAAMVILGGVPGILLGGRLADQLANRVRGARMAIPGYCMLVGNSLFLISYLRLPFWPAWVLETVGFFVFSMAIPALRAGLSDAVPANLRGAGFGAFNLVSVLLGAAGAPLLVSVLSQTFDDNLRTAFLLVSPPVFIGALLLLRARNHLDEDAAKIFQAVLTAMQEQQDTQAQQDLRRSEAQGAAAAPSDADESVAEGHTESS